MRKKIDKDMNTARKNENNWNDTDATTEIYSSYEETYRDGSLKNECWLSEGKPKRQGIRSLDSTSHQYLSGYETEDD